MTDINIKTETDARNGWTFHVEVHHEAQQREFHVELSWSDYDHWSHGRVAPEKVVKALFRFLLEREPLGSIMSKFDCSIVRRYFPEVDRTLPTMI